MHTVERYFPIATHCPPEELVGEFPEVSMLVARAVIENG